MRIEDYAIIGDCETAALVARDGSIDWLCWPRFDSDACFAALLGDDGNGRWKIAPVDEAHVTRCYRKDSLVLETTFRTSTGVARMIDFMPLRDRGSKLVRIVRGVEGRVVMRSELVLRFGYGAVVPWVSRVDGDRIRAVAGPDMVVLDTPVPMHGEDLRTLGEFEIGPGETAPFVLSYQSSIEELCEPIDPLETLRVTEKFWRDWCSCGDVEGEYAVQIRRSLITLKALTHAPTGGLVAAATMSLPEQIGGQRNWDYRYCWVRDATLTLLALMNAGYFTEAAAWRDWLLRAVAGTPEQMQIMYGLGGERRLQEWTVDWLPGYERSGPVRVGNAAAGQFQLDVYGELMDTLHHARLGGLPPEPDGWAVQRVLVEHVIENWGEPDAGIWETRGELQHFTYSKAMAWMVLDRAIKDADAYELRGDKERWKAVCEEIHANVCARHFDAERNTFVRSLEDPGLDASLLLLAEIGFLAPDDPRFAGTVQAIERTLVRDGFVLRYDTALSPDGLPPGEGAFLACSFWLADAYVLLGRTDDARRLFERLLGLANDLGLLAEEYDPTLKRQTGNFPQAFSHIGLVNTAFNLTRTAKPTRQRAERD